MYRFDETCGAAQRFRIMPWLQDDNPVPRVGMGVTEEILWILWTLGPG